MFHLDDITKTPRVALLEDHALVRESLASSLEQVGIEVVGQYSDGDTFLMSVRSLAPDVALVDLMLDRSDRPGGLDGLAVLRALPGISPKTRTIVLSAVRSASALAEARAAGASAYLHKLDADAHRVVSTVMAVARGESLLSPGPVEISTREHSGGDMLTPREQQVLACLATGADNMKVAAMLGITERTARAHVSSLYRKLKRENRAELALLGREYELHPVVSSDTLGATL
jgi:DNA-binding NarL/FixJ family response regulator